MATKKKSKPAKKAAPKKKAKAAPKPARTRSQSPHSQVLPGMEQVTNRSLNRICEAIADVRADLNRIRGEEKELINQATTVMSDTKTSAYRFSGVELVLVPGDVHLRVRLLKNGGAEPAKAEGSGQDAGEIAESLTDGDEYSVGPVYEEDKETA